MVDDIDQRLHPIRYVFGYYVLFVFITIFGTFCAFCVFKYRMNCRCDIPVEERNFCSSAGTEISPEEDGIPVNGGNLFPDTEHKGIQAGYYWLNRYPDVRHILTMTEKR